jgi:hypothetical protein
MASTTIQMKRATALRWSTVNPVLASAEVGVETDTLKFKIGDGVKTWNTLPYFGGLLPVVAEKIAEALEEAKDYTDTLAVSGVHYKGEVANIAALDAIVDPEVGDEYLVNGDADGHTVFAIWDGAEWDYIEINLSDYYTRTEVDTALALKADASTVNTALALKEDKANKGVANGYASLGANGRLLDSEFPLVIDGGVI